MSSIFYIQKKKNEYWLSRLVKNRPGYSGWPILDLWISSFLADVMVEFQRNKLKSLH